jgi:hypothetical protein
VNQQFVRKLFGSAAGAIGSWYKLKDGTRIQVVGIAEDGNMAASRKIRCLRCFFPILQSPSTSTNLVVRSRPGSGNDPHLLAASLRKTLRQLDTGLPITIETRHKPLDSTLFGPRIATPALGVLSMMGAVLSITGIFEWPLTR